VPHETYLRLPVIPTRGSLEALLGCGQWPSDWERGKVLQRALGFDVVPAQSEYEMAAGVYSRLVVALRESEEDDPRGYSPEEREELGRLSSILSPLFLVFEEADLPRDLWAVRLDPAEYPALYDGGLESALGIPILWDWQ
jgi:hypothetical protein